MGTALSGLSRAGRTMPVVDYGRAWDPTSGHCWRLVYDQGTGRPVPCPRPAVWQGVTWDGQHRVTVVCCDEHREGVYDLRRQSAMGR